MIARTASLGTRLVVIVLLGAILPLAIVGVWLANSITRSGETLLHARLDESLGQLARGIGARWIVRRADLLTIAEHEAVQALLTHPVDDADPRGLDFGGVTARLEDAVQSVSVRPTEGQRSWPIISARVDEDPSLSVSFDVFERTSGRRIGVLDARMRLTGLVPSNAAWTAGAGALLGLVDRSTGASLLPMPFDAGLLAQDRFEWAGEQWIVVRQQLTEPAIELVVAAPLLPFAQPFKSATRQGIIALAVVAALATILTTLLTRGTTRSLGKLSDAATTIARGEYGATVDVGQAEDEVGRLARAFNTMSANLKRTLDQLAERQSLAAVGEFAASLAHEVRNPLTAIRIDLQRLEEKAGDNPALREPAASALRAVSRLNATVTSALRVARSGHATLERIDIRVPLRSAMQEALPELRARALELREGLGSEAIVVMGDSAALHQLFLNLLLNAAQATPTNGHVEISTSHSERAVDIRIADSGPGISPALRERVFAPLYSTKAEGTGLGLAIARRIAVAHGGTLDVVESAHSGAVFLIRLPVAGA
ncbi:MAG TPA: ATP-binding protein [Vicinamibacterales bacterium]|nr:ATP-binding protein [Vicinamibacterales bacterium]